MYFVGILLCLTGLVVATPPLARSRVEIEAFQKFLESTKTSDGNNFLARTKQNPLANPEENSGKYQGDIVLDDFMIEDMVKNYATGRNAYIVPNTKWPNNTVVWQFGEGEFGPLQQDAIKDGIADIENHTCVKFRYREPEDTVFVNLTGGPGGCYANVGYWQPRGAHIMNLARNTPGLGCFRHATIVHEWMHILGFLHMHSTYDRDDYVDIIEENIRPGTQHNFDIYTSDLVSNKGIEYDYVSCLHYGPFAFSVNQNATIVAKKEFEGTMGQRIFITEKDWLRINRHYDCAGAWDEKEEKLEVGDGNEKDADEEEFYEEDEDASDEEEQDVGDEEDEEDGYVVLVGDDEEKEQIISQLIVQELKKMKDELNNIDDLRYSVDLK